MDYEKPIIDELKTESDVEQKFIYPLLVAGQPMGFGIRSSSIVTKVNIRQFEIEKGTKQKIYYPDYIIAIGGYPLAIIEAKAPDVDLRQAYREARLYAAELNGIFPSGINPVSVICATNGHEIWLGNADQSQPTIKIPYNDVEPYSLGMANAQTLLGVTALQDRFRDLNQKQRVPRYYKSRRMIGGLAVQQEEVGHNSFGATLAAELGHLFNPVTKQHRLRIAREGYITSPRRERYVDPIDKVIRAATPSWQTRSTLIRDTSEPEEIVKPFADRKDLEHRILLLIGERGSGKTTFLYYLQSIALPKDIREKTVWVHIDVNNAPVVKNEIYDWTRKEIINGIRDEFPDIDFDDFDIIQKIFSVEVNKFNKGIGRLLLTDIAQHNHELYKVLLTCQSDLHETARCYTRHFGSERGCLIVIVFDNADKKPRDEQLLMFEVAQWLQRELRVLVVLPIREETYDNHHDQPPLDTALKDLVFRIEPPVFQQALLRRVQLALNDVASTQDNRRTYELSNGFKVTYAETERSYYIASIAASVFEYDTYARRLIMGLAGNNLRRAFEIFVDFCTSGHISEGEILRMRQSKGEYILPLDVVMTVLLRSNRRYYDSDASVIRNILDLDEKDERPTYFSRIMILTYLRERFTEPGPGGLKGYFSLEQMYEALGLYGLSASVIKREVNYLTRAECIIAESLTREAISESDLFKLGPVGFVHLELLGVAEYWAAIAEDTNFDDRSIARRIADRIVERELQYNPKVSLQNGWAVFDYLQRARSLAAEASGALLAKSQFLSLTDIDAGKDGLESKSRIVPFGQWIEAGERLQPGSEVRGTIVNVDEKFGLFVEIAPGLTGLLHLSRLPGRNVLDVAVKVGEELSVRVVKVEPDRKRISLALASPDRSGLG